MDLRKEMGGKLEDALNKLVDEKLANVSLDSIKAEIHKQVDALVDKYLGDVVVGLGERLKRDFIDVIDGEDDIV
jgi:hypothetical protein